MAKISIEVTAAAYNMARQVVAGAMPERHGIDRLVQEWAMNPASASDYIRNLRQMLSGRNFHRTLNAEALEYYLNHILKDYGTCAAENALSAVRKHIEYYNGLGKGQLKLAAAVCDAFEASQMGLPEASFAAAVNASLKLTAAQRKERLAKAPRKPGIYSVVSTAFKRNPDVVAEVLLRAAGVCEGCAQSAPFKRKSDMTPYLEVHHIVHLANDGEDTVENAIALCPNCHRERHHG